jgi:hypothetical protein
MGAEKCIKDFGQKILGHLETEYRYRGWRKYQNGSQRNTVGKWRLDSYDLQQAAVGYSKHISESLTSCKLQGDQKVSVHLIITIQKVISNVQSVSR